MAQAISTYPWFASNMWFAKNIIPLTKHALHPNGMRIPTSLLALTTLWIFS